MRNGRVKCPFQAERGESNGSVEKGGDRDLSLFRHRQGGGGEVSGNGLHFHAAARRHHATKDIEEQGAIFHQVDLRSSEQIKAFASDLIAASGRVDVLMNSAGYGFFGEVEDVPMAAAREQFEVNLFVAALMIQAILPVMRKQTLRWPIPANGKLIALTLFDKRGCY